MMIMIIIFLCIYVQLVHLLWLMIHELIWYLKLKILLFGDDSIWLMLSITYGTYNFLFIYLFVSRKLTILLTCPHLTNFLIFPKTRRMLPTKSKMIWLNSPYIIICLLLIGSNVCNHSTFPCKKKFCCTMLFCIASCT